MQDGAIEGTVLPSAILLLVLCFFSEALLFLCYRGLSRHAFDYLNGDPSAFPSWTDGSLPLSVFSGCVHITYASATLIVISSASRGEIKWPSNKKKKNICLVIPCKRMKLVVVVGQCTPEIN